MFRVLIESEWKWANISAAMFAVKCTGFVKPVECLLKEAGGSTILSLMEIHATNRGLTLEHTYAP